MGEVFFAKQFGAGGVERSCVVKTLRPELARQARFVGQFLDEARMIAPLQHPNLVSLFEVGEASGVVFLAMEFIEGVDIFTLVSLCAEQQRPLSPYLGAALVRDAARGLAYAHAAVDDDGRPLSLVHRDVSPQNIMVRHDGLVKVVDFGLAKAANRQQQTSDAALIKGKVSYMSPEQASGGALDARSDQYSLGVVLWELLAARPMFETNNPLIVLREITVEQVPAPSSHVPGVPRALEAVCMRMLARDPTQRFPDLAAAAASLDAAISVVDDVDVAAFIGSVAGPTLAAARAARQSGSRVSVSPEPPPPPPPPPRGAPAPIDLGGPGPVDAALAGLAARVAGVAQRVCVVGVVAVDGSAAARSFVRSVESVAARGHADVVAVDATSAVLWVGADVEAAAGGVDGDLAAVAVGLAADLGALGLKAAVVVDVGEVRRAPRPALSGDVVGRARALAARGVAGAVVVDAATVALVGARATFGEAPEAGAPGADLWRVLSLDALARVPPAERARVQLERAVAAAANGDVAAVVAAVRAVAGDDSVLAAAADDVLADLVVAVAAVDVAAARGYAEAWLASARTPKRQAALALALVPLCLKSAAVDAAAAAAARAEAAANDVGDIELVARALSAAAEIAEAREDLSTAVGLLLRAFQMMSGRESSRPDFYWERLNQLGRLHLRLGEADRAAELFAHARQQAERGGRARGIVRAQLNQAVLAANAGDAAGALALLDDAWARADAAADHDGAARAAYNRATLLSQHGRFGDAVAGFEAAAVLATRAAWREGEAMIQSALVAARVRADAADAKSP